MADGAAATVERNPATAKQAMETLAEAGRSALADTRRLVGVLREDPSVAGWPIIEEWKRPESYPVPASWLEAIMAGHDTIEKRVHLDCPVLSMVPTSAYFEEEWCERVFTSDTVLDPTVIAERSLGLSDLVTIARFPGKHDLVLSDAPVREAVYATMRGWLDAFVR